MTEEKIINFITAFNTIDWEKSRLLNFITVFDTVIQEKHRIDTPEKVDSVLTKLLAVIKDLSKLSESSNVRITDIIDRNKLIKYGEFLVNSASSFDLSKVAADKVDEKKTLNNSVLPTELSNNITTISELMERFHDSWVNPLGIKFFESKQVTLPSNAWDDFNQLEEWGERSNHLALFLKFTNVIRDFYDSLIKLDITIPKEDRLRFPVEFIKVQVRVVKDINHAIFTVDTGNGFSGVKSYDKEKFYKGISSLLGLDSISKDKIDDAFGLDGDIFYRFYY
jgi:hypothetical protein